METPVNSDQILLRNLIKSVLVSHRNKPLTSEMIDLTTGEICESINVFFLKLHLE